MIIIIMIDNKCFILLPADLQLRIRLVKGYEKVQPVNTMLYIDAHCPRRLYKALRSCITCIMYRLCLALQKKFYKVVHNSNQISYTTLYRSELIFPLSYFFLYNIIITTRLQIRKSFFCSYLSRTILNFALTFFPYNLRMSEIHNNNNML